MRLFFFSFFALILMGNPVPINVDMFATANFTGTEDVSGTVITISGASSVNFLEQSNPGNAAINISSNSFLNFAQPGSVTYSGALSGSGSVTKTGAGDLVISSNNASFTGPLFVQAGTLFLNGSYGGTVAASPSATIVYSGPISGNLNVNGGTITTDGVNTLQVGGNYTQSADATYVVNVNAAGQSSLLNIAGTATVSGFIGYEVIDGVVIQYPYKILHANGGVTGTFTLLDPPLVLPYLLYDSNNVYLLFGANLASAAITPNEMQVAQQLDQLLTLNADESLVLTSLVSLSPTMAAHVLDQLSGEQYANFMLASLYDSNCLNHLFFDSLRYVSQNCGKRCGGIDSWLNVGGGNGHQKGGFRLSRLDINGGVQSCIGDSWLLGGSLGYERDKLRFSLGGKSSLNTINEALYSLYQIDRYYLMMDLMAGQTWSVFDRPIQFGDISRVAHSQPGLDFGRFDLQVGMNVGNCTYVIQPYVSASAEIYHQGSIRERGANTLNLIIEPVTKWLGSTQLGFHCTFRPRSAFTTFANLAFDVDVAWQHYYGNLKVVETTSFDNFGTTFPIVGPERGHDGAILALSVSQSKGPIEIYVGAEGEVWKNWSAYEFEAGVSYQW